MRYSKLGNTGLEVSNISFGASSLGGVFHDINEMHAIEAVHTALQVGINYIDVAPAYGATKAERVLGKALRNIPRSSYFISTKVGKSTAAGGYGVDIFDYSYDAIMRSIDESASRIGVDYFDIIYLHDIEYNNREHTEWALKEGIETLQYLKSIGSIGSATLVKIALWSFVEGCQSGAPLFVSDPEANGEALISPIFFSFAFASKDKKRVSLRQYILCVKPTSIIPSSITCSHRSTG